MSEIAELQEIMAQCAETWSLRQRFTPEEQARLDAEAQDRGRAQRFAAVAALTPSAHRWAHADAPELATRVKHPHARAWAESPPGSTFVLIAGTTATGKTSLACAAMRTAVIRRHREASECVFMSAHRLGVSRIQSKAGTGESADVERAMSCGWLLLDDLGSERDTANNAIPDVIWERYDRELTTWVTTGLTGAEIKGRYGAGFLRRLLDRSTVVKLLTDEERAELATKQTPTTA
jgi:DNA replication protein DnaC